MPVLLEVFFDRLLGIGPSLNGVFVANFEKSVRGSYEGMFFKHESEKIGNY